MTDPRPSLAVVVPTLDEAERLPDLLDDLGPLRAEVVVVDGGSTDGTVEAAEAGGARVVLSDPGRARQMREGVSTCAAEWLLFLHADSRLTTEAIAAVESFMMTANEGDFAHFGFALDGRGIFQRAIELGQRLRERFLGLVYGDQGLLVSRRLYEQVGGFPDWAIMEDVGIVDRLNRVGRRVPLPARLPTSARRYESEGGIRGWLRNAALMTAFRAGVDPSRLAPWYRPHGSATRTGTLETEHATDRGEVPSPRGVIAFAKAPVPGRVKTRLAADVGETEAVRIYRRLAEDTITGLRGGPWRLLVYVDPPTDAGLESVREWLGEEGIEYRPQAAGDLGARMSAAFEECLVECAEVCIVGTDLPGMGKEWVAEAFAALARGDVVVGPATDGGYYLMALRRPLPVLFQNVLWSTETVLSSTLERALDAGLEAVLLDPRTDVDTVRDVPADLLAG